jgi:hypothetical protein
MYRTGLTHLCNEIFRRMVDMVFGERGDHVIAVVVIRLVADLYSFNTSLLGCLLQVLGKQLSLFVEGIGCSLRRKRVNEPGWLVCFRIQ